MLDPIDYDIIDDIVRVCRQPGRLLRPERLSRKAYHTRGGSYSCGQINERGSHSWFCAAAALVMAGVDIRAQPPAGQWQELLSKRIPDRPAAWDDDYDDMPIREQMTIERDVAVVEESAERPTPAPAPAPEEGEVLLPRWVRRRVPPHDVPTRIVEIVLDIRRVAAAIGAPSPDALQWTDYRFNGGRFTREQVNAVSSWSGLRAAAGAAAGLLSEAA